MDWNECLGLIDYWYFSLHNYYLIAANFSGAFAAVRRRWVGTPSGGVSFRSSPRLNRLTRRPHPRLSPRSDDEDPSEDSSFHPSGEESEPSDEDSGDDRDYQQSEDDRTDEDAREASCSSDRGRPGDEAGDDDTLCNRVVQLLQVARFDFSWGDAEARQKTLENLKLAVKSTKKLCAVMLDTTGPELQVYNRSKQAITLKENDFVTLIPDQGGDASFDLLPINYGGLAKDVKQGDTIFMGKYLFTGSETTSVSLEAAEIKGDNVVCLIKNSATLDGSLFTLHASQFRINLPTLSDKDKKVSAFILVSFVLLSTLLMKISFM